MRRSFLLALMFSACFDDSPPMFDTTDAAACDPSDAGTNDLSPPSRSFGAQIARSGHGDVMVTWTTVATNMFALSHDEGATFTAGGSLPESNATAASVASDGTSFYVATATSSGIFVNRIDPATATIGASVRVSRTTTQLGSFAAPMVAVDNQGTVGVAYSDSYRGFVVARSVDQGSTFTSLAVATVGSLRSRFCIDRAAGTDAPWYLIYENARDVFMLRSLDHGATWPYQTFYAIGAAAEQSPGCVIRGTDIWLAIPGGGSLASEIVVFRSADAGLTFGPTALAARDESFLDPSFGITEAGTLALLYYAGSPNQRVRLVLAESNDGISFRCSELADAGPFPANRTEFTDLLGLELGGGHIFAAFADDAASPAPTRISYVRVDAP